MLKLDVNIFRKEMMNCNESLYINILQYNNYFNYYILFADSWNFSYNKNFELFRDRLNGSTRSFDKLMKNYFNIEMFHQKITAGMHNEIFKILQHEIEAKRIVCMYMDTFWDPVTKDNDTYRYQRDHDYNHGELITGIDSKKKELYYYSPFYTNPTCEFVLPYDHFVNGCHGISTYKKIGENVNDDWKTVINYSLTSHTEKDNKDIFDEMKQFASDINNNFNINDEIDEFYDAPWKSRFFNIITNIFYGRERYSQLLKQFYTQTKNLELLNLSKSMYNIAKKWEIILHLLYKLYYSKAENLKNKIAKKICECAEMEREISEKLNIII